MRSLAVTLLASIVILTPACKGDATSPRQGTPTPEPELAGPPAPGPTQLLSAAGVVLKIPATWTILAEHEPNFAMARAPGDEQLRSPTCTIEVRRQGVGKAADDAKLTALPTGTNVDYKRGLLRGRYRELSSTEGGAVLVHCRSSSDGGWAAIEAAFDSITVEAQPQSPPPVADAPLVELCTGTPSRRTYTCARRRDGAVFCGPSSGEALTRVAGVDAAAQIGCDGAHACSRDEAGALACWKADAPTAVSVDSMSGVRDLVDGCVVDGRGKLSCREREVDGSTRSSFAELLPLAQAGNALSDVQQVLPGTDAEQGCVLDSGGQLRCWDRQGALGLGLADGAVELVETPVEAPRDLARFGGRVCVAGPERWTCLGEGKTHELDACEQRACGCALLGAARLSCDHEPYERLDVQLFGHIGEVVAVDGACAARVDGTVVCRGPVTGQVEDQPQIQTLLVGGQRGVLHLLELRE